MFWSVILGIFTGTRAEELAQINIKNDLKKTTIDGKDIYNLDFNSIKLNS